METKPKLTLFLVLLLSCFTLFSCSGGEERQPNIVFFLVDDLGWRDLGCYGSDFYETPNIDGFAKQGVRFTQAYTTSHVCSPTRASIMTGKYPARLGLTDWLPGRKDYPFQRLKNVPTIQHLPFEEVTIAEALKTHGYATGHFGKWHVGADSAGPLAHGFDIQIPDWDWGWPKAGYHAPFQLDSLEDSLGDYLTDRLTDEALNFIEENRDQPFFLYLSLFSVHDPIEGRADLVQKYDAKLAQQPQQTGAPYILEGNPDAEHPLSRQDLDELIDKESHQDYRVLPQQTVKIKQHQDNTQFAAMVGSVDESLGRVLAKLATLGIDDNTIIIFFSDNGGMAAGNFGYPDRVIDPAKLDKAFSTANLPLRGAKGWLYEGGIRVPMIVKWPGKGKKGTVCETPVISTDFYASILEMAGLPKMTEQHQDGMSFLPYLKGENSPNSRAIYWHFPHYSNHGMQSPGGAIVYGDYKLLEYYENNSVQLFNLKEDIGEQNDLSSTHPEKTAELRTMLHNWRESVSARMMEPNPDYVEASQ